MDSKQLMRRQQIVSHSMKESTYNLLQRDKEMDEQKMRREQVMAMNYAPGAINMTLNSEHSQRIEEEEQEKREAALYAKPVMDLETKEGRSKAKEIAKQKKAIVSESIEKNTENDMVIEIHNQMYTNAITEDQKKHGYDYAIEGKNVVGHSEGVLEQFEREIKFYNGEELAEEDKNKSLGYRMAVLEQMIQQDEEAGKDTTEQEAEYNQLKQRFNYLRAEYEKQRQTLTANSSDVNRASKLMAFAPKAQKRLIGKKLTANSEFEQRFFANLALYSPEVIIGGLRNEMAEVSISIKEFTTENVLANYSSLREKLSRIGNMVNVFQGKDYENLPANERARVASFKPISNYGMALIDAILKNVGLERKEGKFVEGAQENEGLQEQIEELRQKLSEAIDIRESQEIGNVADSLAADNMEKYRKSDEITKGSARFGGLLLIEQSQRESYEKFTAILKDNAAQLESEAKKAGVDILKNEFIHILEAQTELINEIEAINIFGAQYRNMAKADVEEIEARSKLMLDEADLADQKAEEEKKAEELEKKQEEGEQQVKEAVEKKDENAAKNQVQGDVAEQVKNEGRNHEAVKKEIDAIETKIRTGNYIDGVITSDSTIIALFKRIDERKYQLAGLKARAELMLKGLQLLAKGIEDVPMTTDELAVLNQIGVAKEEYESRQKKGREHASIANGLDAEMKEKFKEFVTGIPELGAEFYEGMPVNIRILYRFYDSENEIRKDMIKNYLIGYKNHRALAPEGNEEALKQAERENEFVLQSLTVDILRELSSVDLIALQSETKEKKDGELASVIERRRILAEGVEGLLKLANITGQNASDTELAKTIKKDYLEKGVNLVASYLSNMGNQEKYRRICEAYEAGELGLAKDSLLTEDEYKQVAAWVGVYYFDKATKESMNLNRARLQQELAATDEGLQDTNQHLEAVEKKLAEQQKRVERLVEEKEYLDSQVIEHEAAAVNDPEIAEFVNELLRRSAEKALQINRLRDEIEVLPQVITAYRTAKDSYLETKAAKQKDIDALDEKKRLEESNGLEPKHIYQYARYMMAVSTQSKISKENKELRDNEVLFSKLREAVSNPTVPKAADKETELARDYAAIRNVTVETTDESTLVAAKENLEQQIIIAELERNYQGDDADELYRINQEMVDYEKGIDTLRIAVAMVGEKKIESGNGQYQGIFANMRDLENYQQTMGMEDKEYKQMLKNLSAASAMDAEATQGQMEQAKNKQKQGAEQFKTVIAPYYDGIEAKFGMQVPSLEYVIAHIEECKELYTRTHYDNRIIKGFGMEAGEDKEAKLLFAKMQFYEDMMKYCFAALKRVLSDAIAQELPGMSDDMQELKARLSSSLEKVKQLKA